MVRTQLHSFRVGRAYPALLLALRESLLDMVHGGVFLLLRDRDKEDERMLRVIVFIQARTAMSQVVFAEMRKPDP